MDQYHPVWHVLEEGHPLYRKLRRRITPKEYDEAVDAAHRAGIHRGIPWDYWK